MGKQHIIELNGKRYDALTGKMITEPLTIPLIKTKSASTKSMEGIARRPMGQAKSPELHRRPIEKSHTLMRKTVHKPINNKLHAVATIIGQKPIQPKTVTKQTSTAKPIAKSGLIHRFSTSTGNPNADIALSKNNTSRPSINNSLSHAAINAASVVVDPLNQAIAKATSHQQPKLKRPRFHSRVAAKLHVSPKIISAGSATLAILLIAGFFGYQNVPNLKMRLASSRAGLHGTLPAYQPAGFRLNDISYKTGQINISFRSNSDTRNFTVTQEASSWNSDTLRDKLKTTEQVSSPVEVPDKGKTLFIYNDSNVTWVDGGILYKIEGDSKLNSEQLLHLANSM